LGRRGYSDQLAFYGFEQPTESPQARREEGLVVERRLA